MVPQDSMTWPPTQLDLAYALAVQAAGCHRLPVCMQVLDDVSYKKSMLEKLIWIW